MFFGHKVKFEIIIVMHTAVHSHMTTTVGVAIKNYQLLLISKFQTYTCKYTGVTPFTHV